MTSFKRKSSSVAEGCHQGLQRQTRNPAVALWRIYYQRINYNQRRLYVYHKGVVTNTIIVKTGFFFCSTFTIWLRNRPEFYDDSFMKYSTRVIRGTESNLECITFRKIIALLNDTSTDLPFTNESYFIVKEPLETLTSSQMGSLNRILIVAIELTLSNSVILFTKFVKLLEPNIIPFPRFMRDWGLKGWLHTCESWVQVSTESVITYHQIMD